MKLTQNNLEKIRMANTMRAVKGFNHSPTDPGFYLLGLLGEVGELSNYVKKEIRDSKSFITEIEHEVADILTYLDLYAGSMGFDLAPSPVLPKGGVYPLQECLLLGQYVGSICRQQVIYSGHNTTGVDLPIGAILITICNIADYYGFDLMDAFMIKFNMVSNRVCSPVMFNLKTGDLFF